MENKKANSPYLFARRKIRLDDVSTRSRWCRSSKLRERANSGPEKEGRKKKREKEKEKSGEGGGRGGGGRGQKVYKKRKRRGTGEEERRERREEGGGMTAEDDEEKREESKEERKGEVLKRERPRHRGQKWPYKAGAPQTVHRNSPAVECNCFFV